MCSDRYIRIMRKTIYNVVLAFAITLVGIPNRTVAQTPYPVVPTEDFLVLDSSMFVLLYEFFQQEDSMKASDKSRDLLVLEIGEKMSRFYSDNLRRHDSLCTVLMKRDVSAIPGASEGVYPVDVYKNYAEQKDIVIQRFPMKGIFMYDDTLNCIDWKIQEDFMDVLGYRCQKATADFRGRKWIVWFTMDIPLPEGPWKLYGLPGTILRAKDKQGHYEFVCVEISRKKQPIFRMEHYYYEKSTLRDVQDLEKKMCLSYYDFIQVIMPGFKNFRKKEGGSMTREEVNERKKKPYNPIELE